MKFHDKKLSSVPEDGNLEVYLNQKDDSNIAARIKCINQDIFNSYNYRHQANSLTCNISNSILIKKQTKLVFQHFNL